MKSKKNRHSNNGKTEAVVVSVSSPICSPPKSAIMALMNMNRIKVYEIKERLIVKDGAMLFYVSHVFVPTSLGRWVEYILLNFKNGYFKLEGKPIGKSNRTHTKRSEGPAQPYITQSCIESMKSSGHDEDVAKLKAVINLIKTNIRKGIERPKPTEAEPTRKRRVRVSGQPALPERSTARPTPLALPERSIARPTPVDWATKEKRETAEHPKQRGR